jgi:hypothetical protein
VLLEEGDGRRALLFSYQPKGFPSMREVQARQLREYRAQQAKA